MTHAEDEGWRRAHLRLMALSRNGKAIRMASGSLAYLELLARRSLNPGRKWIERNTQPASTLTLKRPRRPRSRTGDPPCTTGGPQSS